MGNGVVGYEQTGTQKKVRNLGATFKKYAQQATRLQQTRFQYGKWCIYEPFTGSHWWKVKPIKHKGGARSPKTKISTPPNRYCEPYPKGHGGDVDETTAKTWSKGVNFKGPIGIDLSSRTGFTTSSRYEWTMQTSGRACGVAGHIAGTPGGVVLLGKKKG